MHKGNEGGAFAQSGLIRQEQALAAPPSLPEAVHCLHLMRVQARPMLLHGRHPAITPRPRRGALLCTSDVEACLMFAFTAIKQASNSAMLDNRPLPYTSTVKQ